MPQLADLHCAEQMVRRFKDVATGAPAFYEACKAIDGYRGPGTFNLIACRVYGFYFQPDRQPFYEPLSAFADVKVVSDVNYVLVEGAARKEGLAHIAMSFRVFDSADSAPGVACQCRGRERRTGAFIASL